MIVVFGVLHGVLSEITDKISETAVGPIFTGHEQNCEFASSLVMNKNANSHSYS